MREIQVPALFILDTASHEFYVPDFDGEGELSFDSLEKFVQQVESGEAEVRFRNILCEPVLTNLCILLYDFTVTVCCCTE